MGSVSSEKAALRARVKAVRLTEAERTAASEAICARLEGLLASSSRVLLYAPMGDEVDVWPLVERLTGSRMQVGLPRADWKQGTMQAAVYNGDADSLLRSGPGIREPGPTAEAIATDTLDAVVVPGVAFDPQGGRLGRGGGFYDRLLAGVSPHCRLIGTAFDHQVVERVPREAHDLPMHAVVTPSRTMEAGRTSAAGGNG